MRIYGKTGSLIGLLLAFAPIAGAQLVDNNLAPNTAKAGINKSLADEIGPGRGDIMTPNSSLFIINRDPFRSVRARRCRGVAVTHHNFLGADPVGRERGKARPVRQRNMPVAAVLAV